MKPTDYGHSPRHQGPRHPVQAADRKLAGYFLRDLLIAWLGGAAMGLALALIPYLLTFQWLNPRNSISWLNPLDNFLWVAPFLIAGAGWGAFLGNRKCPPAASLAWAVPLAVFTIGAWGLGATASWAVFWRVMFTPPWRAHGVAPLAFTAPLLSTLAYNAGAVLFPNARWKDPPARRRGRRNDKPCTIAGGPFIPSV